MRKFGDAIIERSGVLGYRQRKKDEIDIFLIKNLISELRDDALTLITPSIDTAEAERVEQTLGRIRSIKPEFW